VIDAVMAGDDPKTSLSAGESVRIMTGAPLPLGADAVCMVERTRLDANGAYVIVEDVVDAGANVRQAGEDISTGELVFGPGTILGPAHLGVLSSLGIDTVMVHPRPVVGVLSTGDELTTSADELAPGKIRDANRPALLAQLGVDRFGSLDLGVVGDDEGALVARIEDAASSCDAVVASGGVSVGDRDVMDAVLDKLCRSSARSVQVAVKPAKPFAFGMMASSRMPIFGLPGNPVSALVSYELFVRPALRLMAGHVMLDRPRFFAVAESNLTRRRDGKLHLLRVVVRADTEGTLHARLSGGQDSHMLHAMAEANGFALVPDGEGVAMGERVEVLLIGGDDLLDTRTGAW
jgi:molybdenum cofactor synthesis domain-containing protein